MKGMLCRGQPSATRGRLERQAVHTRLNALERSYDTLTMFMVTHSLGERVGVRHAPVYAEMCISDAPSTRGVTRDTEPSMYRRSPLVVWHRRVSSAVCLTLTCECARAQNTRVAYRELVADPSTSRRTPSTYARLKTRSRHSAIGSCASERVDIDGDSGLI